MIRQLFKLLWPSRPEGVSIMTWKEFRSQVALGSLSAGQEFLVPNLFDHRRILKFLCATFAKIHLISVMYENQQHTFQMTAWFGLMIIVVFAVLFWLPILFGTAGSMALTYMAIPMIYLAVRGIRSILLRPIRIFSPQDEEIQKRAKQAQARVNQTMAKAQAQMNQAMTSMNQQIAQMNQQVNVSMQQAQARMHHQMQQMYQQMKQMQQINRRTP